jgi:cytosine/adenosine deaminase-related metal-dependent hydrolase
MSRMYERDPLTTVTEVDGEMFLVKPGVEDIHHLDQIASGIWRFLGVTRGLDEMQTVLEDAFPEVPAQTLRDDLKRALDGMIDAGFVQTHPPRADEVNAEAR